MALKKTAELTDDQVSAELAALDLEEKRLRLELLREQVERERAKRMQLIEAIKKQAATILKAQQRRKREQSACSHKKGGRGRENILNGNAPEFSIVVQTEAWGETYVLCTRCLKEWRKPLAVLQLVNPLKFKEIVKKDKKAYIAALEEFNAATRMMTDNSPSGSTLVEFRQGFEDDENAA